MKSILVHLVGAVLLAEQNRHIHLASHVFAGRIGMVEVVVSSMHQANARSRDMT